MAGERRIQLVRTRVARGSRSIDAELRAEGSLVIDGQDLGPQVQVLGEDFREYEWAWTAPASEVPRIVEVLGGDGGDDPLQVLLRWQRENGDGDPGSHLRDSGVPLEFWSRLGD